MIKKGLSESEIYKLLYELTCVMNDKDKCLESAEEFLHNKENITKKYPLQNSNVCIEKQYEYV